MPMWQDKQTAKHVIAYCRTTGGRRVETRAAAADLGPFDLRQIELKEFIRRPNPHTSTTSVDALRSVPS